MVRFASEYFVIVKLLSFILKSIVPQKKLHGIFFSLSRRRRRRHRETARRLQVLKNEWKLGSRKNCKEIELVWTMFVSLFCVIKSDGSLHNAKKSSWVSNQRFRRFFKSTATLSASRTFQIINLRFVHTKSFANPDLWFGRKICAKEFSISIWKYVR